MVRVATVAELVVVGGGPAGLAAATTAADLGCSVVLVDSAARLGGQYYRQLPAQVAVADPGALHHDFRPGAELLDRVRAHPAIRVYSSTTVWAAHRDGDQVELQLLYADGSCAVLRTRTVVLATGAYDRSLPFPGWTLPGVVTAGGAQALLKGQYVLAGRRVVVAGSGPFLLPVAAGLAESGAEVLGVFDASTPARWARHAGTVARTPGKLGEAADYLQTLRQHRVPVRFGRAVTRAHGGPELRAVTVSRLDRRWRPRSAGEQRIEVDALAVGWGFTPNVELAIALGVPTAVDPVDGSVLARADPQGCTAVPTVLVAGEITGVGGSALATTEGRLAGLAAARRCGRLTAEQLARQSSPLRRRRLREVRFARALLDVYAVQPGWMSWLSDDTVLCRCEEVTIGCVDAVVHDLGATDLRSLKLLSRVGMGMCQGRVCGQAAGCLLAARTGRPVLDLAGFSARPLAVPVPLGVLADEPPSVDGSGDV